jgi:polygalacturonase
MILKLLCSVHGIISSPPIFNVLNFGAKGDNVTDDSRAIRAAYAACNASGAGTVVFPAPHTFRSGPIVMHCSNSITVIEGVWAARATTLNWPFGLDCPEPSQGGPPQQMAPLLLLDHVHNVTIRGGGTLDGNGEMWWRHACGNWWCPPENAHAGAETETTKTPPKKAFRPFLLRIEHSHDVTVENITFFNPGFWNLVPVRSQHILIQDVNVTARWPEGSKKPAPADPYAATPNTDGFEPMWSNHVTFRRCRVLNGDDCITIKSGSSNILVEDLYCEHGDGLTIGSIWYDDVTNVTYRRVVMNRTHNGPMIKGRSQGNATVSNITFENIELIDVRLALTVDCVYETLGTVVPNTGVQALGITFRNISGTVIQEKGLDHDPTMLTDASGTFFAHDATRKIEVTLENIVLRKADRADKTPPAWLCNHSNITVRGVVEPPLSESCRFRYNEL